MISRHLSRLVLGGMLSIAGLTASAADPEQSKVVATDISQTDADFSYQGEYSGTVMIPVSPDRLSRHNYGLQVVALGDGAFDAVVFTGGLPGAGWDGSTKHQLAGTLQDKVVRFEGAPFQIEVGADGAVFYVNNRRTLGIVPKVYRGSPTLGAAAPIGSKVLFDGTSTDAFVNGRMTPDGLLMEGADTKDPMSDFSMHIEFRLPYMPYARGQGRANSGVYIEGRYEVQILDSFGLDGVANECGALYKQLPPNLNMCLPPLSWQTYDIVFTAPKFDADGKKTANARITAWQNGILIHNNAEVVAKTGAGRPEGPQPLPTKLQNHGNPVRFRNIWISTGRVVPPQLQKPQSAAPPLTASVESPATTIVIPNSALPPQAWRFEPNSRISWPGMASPSVRGATGIVEFPYSY